MKWFVFDPSPELGEEGSGPHLYGPKIGSWTKDEAENFANLMHPDDMDGDAVVVSLTEVP